MMRFRVYPVLAAAAFVCCVVQLAAAQSILDWAVHGTDPDGPGFVIPYDISVARSGDRVAVIGLAREGAVVLGEEFDNDPYRFGLILETTQAGQALWSSRGLVIPQWDGMMGYLAASSPIATYTAEGLHLIFDAGQREIGGHAIVAYDPSGDKLWVAAVADTTDTVAEIAAFIKALELDESGNLYYAALIMDTITVDGIDHVAEGVDALVASLNADGTYRWVTTITGPGSQYVGSIVDDYSGAFDVTAGGYSALAGYFSAGATFGVGEATETTLDETVTGVAYYDSTGSFVRVDQDCSNLEVCGGNLYLPRIAVANDKSIRTIWWFGEHEGQLEVEVGGLTLNDPGFGGAFVTSHDSTGNLRWVTQFRGYGNEFLLSIDTDAEGNTYVGGSFDALEMTIGSEVTLRKSDLQVDEFDGLIARLDSLGRVTWTMHMSGPENQYINAIDVDSLGNVYFASHFGGTATIGDDVFESSATDWLHGRISISTINSVNDEQPMARDVVAYPNPARDRVSVRSAGSCGGARIIETSVFDVLGRRVLTSSNGPADLIDVSFDVRPLSSGVYFASVTCGGERVVTSFVISR